MLLSMQTERFPARDTSVCSDAVFVHVDAGYGALKRQYDEAQCARKPRSAVTSSKRRETAPEFGELT